MRDSQPCVNVYVICTTFGKREFRLPRKFVLVVVLSGSFNMSINLSTIFVRK